MRKIAILLIVLLLSIVIVEAQMFVSPGRNVAARKKAETTATMNYPIQSASVDYMKRYRSERERIKSAMPIIGNKIDPSMNTGRKETVTRSLKKVSGIGVVTARTSQLQWKPRTVLPVKQSHQSVLFNRKRSA